MKRIAIRINQKHLRSNLIPGLLLSLLSLACCGAESAKAGEPEFTPVFTHNHSSELLAYYSVYGDDVLQATAKTAAEMPFLRCLELDIKQPGTSPYAVNLQFFEPNQWKKGDTGLISFWCRTLDTKNRFGSSSLKLQYKPDYSDWRGMAETDLYLTREWKQVFIPFEVKIDAADTPKMVLNFFLGGVDPHTIQLADLQVYGYGKTVALDQLPRSRAHYPGMEADAAWRKAAKARIEEHRKADTRIKITDTEGRPVSGAKVHVRLERHKFGFGAAVHSPMLVSPDIPEQERKQYSDILTRTCSKITPANAMKWRLYEHFKQYVPDLIAWCEAHDMTLRGHLLIWPGFKRLPEGYDLYKTDPAAFRKDLLDHITEFVNLYPEAFSEWDVLNEPYTEYDFMDLLGKEVVLEWFETARKANPNYLNYINDYGILADNNAEHQDDYYAWISYLLENNAPLDGIGFQGHYKTATPPELILERIDRYAAFGKKMQITEFDFDHTDPELQARFFEDFVTLIYSHPQMEALINWIFLEDDFRPKAALYRKDFSPTAMGMVWERLLTADWHTEKTALTDAQGEIELRGFKGIYSMTIEHNGTTTAHKLVLDDGGNISIVLGASSGR
jgi:GH35 family endo-1,4-beta-xylanase